KQEQESQEVDPRRITVPRQQEVRRIRKPIHPPPANSPELRMKQLSHSRKQHAESEGDDRQVEAPQMATQKRQQAPQQRSDEEGDQETEPRTEPQRRSQQTPRIPPNNKEPK